MRPSCHRRPRRTNAASPLRARRLAAPLAVGYGLARRLASPAASSEITAAALISDHNSAIVLKYSRRSSACDNRASALQAGTRSERPQSGNFCRWCGASPKFGAVTAFGSRERSRRSFILVHRVPRHASAGAPRGRVRRKASAVLAVSGCRPYPPYRDAIRNRAAKRPRWPRRSPARSSRTPPIAA